MSSYNCGSYARSSWKVSYDPVHHHHFLLKCFLYLFKLVQLFSSEFRIRIASKAITTTTTTTSHARNVLYFILKIAFKSHKFLATHLLVLHSMEFELTTCTNVMAKLFQVKTVLEQKKNSAIIIALDTVFLSFPLRFYIVFITAFPCTKSVMFSRKWKPWFCQCFNKRFILFFMSGKYFPPGSFTLSAVCCCCCCVDCGWLSFKFIWLWTSVFSSVWNFYFN